MTNTKSVLPHIGNQGSVMLDAQEASALKTGDIYNLNGIDVTILLVLPINSKKTEIVYYIPQ